MLLDENPIRSSKIGFFFHFSFSNRLSIDILQKRLSQSLIGRACLGAYRTGSDETINIITSRKPARNVADPSLTEKDPPEANYLPHYRRNIYRRVRNHARRSRDTLVFELKPLSVLLVQLNNSQPIAIPPSSVTLEGIITVQSSGIGCLMLWLNGFKPNSSAQWCELRDPELISVTIEPAIFSRTVWPTIAMARYLIAQTSSAIFAAGSAPMIKEDDELLTDADAFEKFLIESVTAVKSPITRMDVRGSIEVYPFVFIQYDLGTSELKAAVNNSGGDIRLALCGDKNWKWKRKSVIDETVLGADTSTRDSIFWFVNSDGFVKLCSNDLETPVPESFTAALLETDAALTLRYFLHRMNSLLSALTSSALSPADFAVLRFQLLTDFESYAAIENSHKDTTRARVERYKDILHISLLYRSVVDRFEILAARLQAAHSRRTERHSALLTLVFGFFGALGGLFQILFRFGEKNGWELSEVVKFSLMVACIVTLTLWLIIRFRIPERPR